MIRWLRPRWALIGYLVFVGAALLLAGTRGTGNLRERQDALREAHVAIERNARDACARENTLRGIMRERTLDEQQRAATLDHRLFNVTRSEFNRLLAQRREAAWRHLMRLRPVSCPPEP